MAKDVSTDSYIKKRSLNVPSELFAGSFFKFQCANTLFGALGIPMWTNRKRLTKPGDFQGRQKEALTVIVLTHAVLVALECRIFKFHK